MFPVTGDRRHPSVILTRSTTSRPHPPIDTLLLVTEWTDSILDDALAFRQSHGGGAGRGRDCVVLPGKEQIAYK